MKVHQPTLKPSNKTPDNVGEVIDDDRDLDYIDELKDNARFQEIVIKGILEERLAIAQDIMNVPVVEPDKLQVVLLAKQENVQFIKDIISILKRD